MGRLRTWQHVRTQLLLRSRGREQLTFERRSTPATTTHAPRRLARACVLGSGGSLTERRGSGIPWLSRQRAARIRATAASPSRGALGIALVFAFLFLPGQPHPDARAQVSTRPNVLVVLTDDQMIGALGRGMPYLSSEPGAHWVSFTNAFVHYPLCCPSRVTILSGLYAHHHGVKSNSGGSDSTIPPRWPRGSTRPATRPRSSGNTSTTIRSAIDRTTTYHPAGPAGSRSEHRRITTTNGTRTVPGSRTARRLLTSRPT